MHTPRSKLLEAVTRLSSTPFLDEVDLVFEAIQAMPLRFPIAYGTVHRALLSRYPFAVFFRIRPKTQQVVVLAVFPQRGDPSRWPKR